ncbi:mucin-binding protein, partial [Limosilactobacillus equigenerosi]|uniref:mucin-binding protein n=1 Tax=Limosilactobacillus equigenerosi TaxID=417373 RepID=UPI003B845D73
HGEETVTPDNPHHPGDPINPNGNPAGPKYTPDQTKVATNHTMTVKYQGADHNPADNVQTSHWTRSVTIDKVTGETISTTPWVSGDHYEVVKTPIVTGYVADQASV